MKKIEVICPICNNKRFVTYSQLWNIKKGISSGRCQKCAGKYSQNTGQFTKGQIAWNKGLIGYHKGHKAYIKACGEDNFFFGKHHTKEWKKQQSIRKGGTGIPYENSEYSSEFNEKLRNKIRKRDNYICQLCSMIEEEHIIVYGKVLCIHHIDYNKKNCNRNNLTSLCFGCNIRVNYNRDYWQEYFQKLIGEKKRNGNLQTKI